MGGRRVAVFPAHAGMNHTRQPMAGSSVSVPRACGDEPNPASVSVASACVFPAHAEMNLLGRSLPR